MLNVVFRPCVADLINVPAGETLFPTPTKGVIDDLRHRESDQLDTLDELRAQIDRLRREITEPERVQVRARQRVVQRVLQRVLQRAESTFSVPTSPNPSPVVRYSAAVQTLDRWGSRWARAPPSRDPTAAGVPAW